MYSKKFPIYLRFLKAYIANFSSFFMVMEYILRYSLCTVKRTNLYHSSTGTVKQWHAKCVVYGSKLMYSNIVQNTQTFTFCKIHWTLIESVHSHASSNITYLPKKTLLYKGQAVLKYSSRVYAFFF